MTCSYSRSSLDGEEGTDVGYVLEQSQQEFEEEKGCF